MATVIDPKTGKVTIDGEVVEEGTTPTPTPVFEYTGPSISQRQAISAYREGTSFSGTPGTVATQTTPEGKVTVQKARPGFIETQKERVQQYKILRESRDEPKYLVGQIPRKEAAYKGYSELSARERAALIYSKAPPVPKQIVEYEAGRSFREATPEQKAEFLKKAIGSSLIDTFRRDEAERELKKDKVPRIIPYKVAGVPYTEAVKGEKGFFMQSGKEFGGMFLELTKKALTGTGKLLYYPAWDKDASPKIEIGQSKLLKTEGDIFLDPDVRTVGIVGGLALLSTTTFGTGGVLAASTGVGLYKTKKYIEQPTAKRLAEAAFYFTPLLIKGTQWGLKGFKKGVGVYKEFKFKYDTNKWLKGKTGDPWKQEFQLLSKENRADFTIGKGASKGLEPSLTKQYIYGEGKGFQVIEKGGTRAVLKGRQTQLYPKPIDYYSWKKGLIGKDLLKGGRDDWLGKWVETPRTPTYTAEFFPGPKTKQVGLGKWQSETRLKEFRYITDQELLGATKKGNILSQMFRSKKAQFSGERILTKQESVIFTKQENVWAKWDTESRESRIPLSTPSISSGLTPSTAGASILGSTTGVGFASIFASAALTRAIQEREQKTIQPIVSLGLGVSPKTRNIWETDTRIILGTMSIALPRTMQKSMTRQKQKQIIAPYSISTTPPSTYDIFKPRPRPDIPPPPPPTTDIPPPWLFDDPLRIRKKKKSFWEPSRREFKYTATIQAGQFDIFGKPVRVQTGVGIRPLPFAWRKYRKTSKYRKKKPSRKKKKR